MKWIKWIYVFLLAYFSLEILWRRLFWEQIPTQVSPALVYSTLALNVLVLVILFSKMVRTQHKSRED